MELKEAEESKSGFLYPSIAKCFERLFISHNVCFKQKVATVTDLQQDTSSKLALLSQYLQTYPVFRSYAISQFQAQLSAWRSRSARVNSQKGSLSKQTVSIVAQYTFCLLRGSAFRADRCCRKIVSILLHNLPPCTELWHWFLLHSEASLNERLFALYAVLVYPCRSEEELVVKAHIQALEPACLDFCTKFAAEIDILANHPVLNKLISLLLDCCKSEPRRQACCCVHVKFFSEDVVHCSFSCAHRYFPSHSIQRLVSLLESCDGSKSLDDFGLNGQAISAAANTCSSATLEQFQVSLKTLSSLNELRRHIDEHSCCCTGSRVCPTLELMLSTIRKTKTLEAPMVVEEVLASLCNSIEQNCSTEQGYICSATFSLTLLAFYVSVQTGASPSPSFSQLTYRHVLAVIRSAWISVAKLLQVGYCFSTIHLTYSRTVSALYLKQSL